MEDLDLVIANGTVATASDVFRADVGIRDGRIAALGRGLPAREVIDASGKYVLPGAVDVHTHLDMPLGQGLCSSDDFATGSVAAACGGTTTIVDYAIQEKGRDLHSALQTWHDKARGRSAVDYSFHMTICDPSDAALDQMAEVVAAGVTSFKLLFAYKGAAMVDDAQFFRVMRRASELGALVNVHCENGHVIDELVRERIAAGHTAPIDHVRSRPPRAEAAATARAIALAEMAGAPVYIVHLTCAEALQEVRRGRERGVRVLAETCPQYLLLSEDLCDTPDFSGAKFVLSPPLRARENQAVLWCALESGELDVVGTDHCPWFYRGQKERGLHDFRAIPNGLPGIETRLPLLFSEGFAHGRLSLPRLVAVCSTNPARIFGLYPLKGAIAPGSDADLVVVDPEARVTLRHERLHQNVDYTPYEGLDLHGYPVLTLRRGEVIVRDGQFVGRRGAGEFLRRERFAAEWGTNTETQRPQR